ncbi:FAD-binding and (Fe-S)-binding domain-containing protein [Botrimarina hoheduenensis]|uniref:Anaerobic glycerol-3-phosphate dehydrogenase subunit C n=1 Tax=Botrimarina hoheduenensis TaxID=2528000 RepID=A0A5C5WF30_9BACT|nr:FAD-binding and (Fe-S)-binding domain-containing protein [Botrimarina hoheduenensis]TWT48699.1 Anaerobic glycerol-3-phosphate dehydrogenase subunit C [Botrimarina hoheduenensis]
MADPNRIAEDLRGVTSGDVLSDVATRRLYASDGSLYQIMPAAVVRPRVTADVAATVRYASENGIPVHARGAGSGLAGGVLGTGIVIDFSRYMRRLIADEGETVVAQAGLPLAELNRRLAPDRTFGPDPANRAVSTVGGAVATDASGSRRNWFGSVGDAVREMTVVLASGETVRLDATGVSDATAAASSIERSVDAALRTNTSSISEYTPGGCVSTSGYALAAAAGLPEDRSRLARLMIGSEGTLGVLTEVRLAVHRPSQGVAAGLFTFASIELAAQAAANLVGQSAAACDLLDRRHLGLCRQRDPRYSVMIPGEAEALLFVEARGENESEAIARLAGLAERLRAEAAWGGDTLLAETEEDRRLFASLPASFLPTLQGIEGRRHATPGFEAISLPPSALGQFFRRVQEVLKRRQVTASVFAHTLHGHVQVWPLLDLSAPGELRRLETLASDLYDIVWLLGGSITGVGGDGLSRTPFTSRQHGPLVNVFREIKRIVDPRGVLNPGKIVPMPGARMTHATRYAVAADSTSVSAPSNAVHKSTVALQLNWTADAARLAADACNGCGDCRRSDETTRMCPIFRYTPREEASPRAKANLLRGVLSGELPTETLATDEARQIADLCVNCHQCRLDCAAGVDIPRMMLEAKASHVAANGMRLDGWWCSRIDSLAAAIGRAPRLGNALIQRAWFRWCLERVTGLSAARRLPALAGRPFLASSLARKLAKPVSHSGDRVAYFVDTFANRFDTELAEAFVAVLRRHGVAVYAPPTQAQSGMAMISQGGLEPARRLAERNVAVLAEAIRQGHTVVATEPSAVLALTHEYRVLLPDDEDAALVAENTEEACLFLWRRHLNARLSLELDPLPIRVAYHQPCHSRALGVGVPAEKLMRLIPDLMVERIDQGCSGMAGTYGLLKRNYRSSLRAGLPMLNALRRGDSQAGATECSTCRLQMQQAATVPTFHPIKLLAASYGDLPGLRKVIDRMALESHAPARRGSR